MEGLVADAVRHFLLRAGPDKGAPGEPVDPVLGMFADEPGLIDDIAAAAMAARERDALRPAS